MYGRKKKDDHLKFPYINKLKSKEGRGGGRVRVPRARAVRNYIIRRVSLKDSKLWNALHEWITIVIT